MPGTSASFYKTAGGRKRGVRNKCSVKSDGVQNGEVVTLCIRGETEVGRETWGKVR